MYGKPVIRGTRITVENVLERLGSGESIEDVLEAYPQLSAAAVRAALAFAAKVLGGEVALPDSNDAVDDEWAAEVERRIAALRSGMVMPIPGEQALKDLEDEFTK